MKPPSLAAQMFAASPPTIAPPSFNGDATLFGWNLFLMTAAACLGLLMAGKQGRRIWANRFLDHPLHPVSLYRTMLMLAGCALCLRGAAEAVYLWSWSTGDVVTIGRAIMAKRWIDPISIGCTLVWMAAAILGEPGLEHQLRKAPLPVDMWSRWPALRRAAYVVGLSFAMAASAVILR